jgi:radical SAM family uncharacterized protein
VRTENGEYINPVNALGGLLLSVEKPGRYVGGEVGCLAKNREQEIFRTLIAFPDLYEIGMGNQALRIIYNYMNNISGILCDRAFAPAPDFEKLLRENNMPLYGLDTGIGFAHLDLLMFTIGYELGLNGILTMLDVSGIPLRCEERSEEYPIIIAGGPAVSNPLPYSPFIDAFWIGEAEAGFFDLAAELANLKKMGKGREVLLEKIISHSNVWTNGKTKAVRAIYSGFSEEQQTESPSLVYPVPSMKIVQNHGAVEIMRGCPNGCRFCHAGFWYRPARQKTKKQIIRQVDEMVTKGGWPQISLSSLSSGDYYGIDKLIENLNQRFSDKHVSFQLPSLKVSGFALSILEKISVTRKSGITFAVETPQDLWQIAINKEVSRNSVVSIIEEARKRGWKGAKFYFMIGLPHNSELMTTDSFKCEEEEIVSFIVDVARRTRMHFNINIGIFIPKPHTPYQWAAQINSEDAFKKLSFIRSKLKPLGHKVSVSDTLISRIEGLLSRGDKRAGLLCEEAWRGGSRLDPWDEFINKDKWLEILEKNFEYVDSVFKGKNEVLPWAQIKSCVSDKYFKHELEKSNKPQRTVSCREKCNSCGVCTKELKINNTQEFLCQTANQYEVVNHKEASVNEDAVRKSDPPIYRILFSFNKEGSAVFHGHLSLIDIFSMSFRRADIPVMYTQGFNPLAKIEFASPLSTGINAGDEAAIVDFADIYDTGDFLKKLNDNLPDGIRVNRAEIFFIKSGQKKHSLSSLFWGSVYSAANKESCYVNVLNEKVYRQERLEKDCSSLFDFKRSEVLARNVIGGAADWASYFDVYNYLYS